MQYLFLDTNIFIHFLDFEQIDWQKLLDTREKIVITIAPIVIDELDKQKYSKNQKISKRVRSLLPKIERFILNPSLCKYDLIYIKSRPIDQTFSDNNLDRKEQDDNLLATIIEFSKSIKLDEKVIYVTNDVGPRLKAESLNISTYKPASEFLLANEPDETEAENISLRKQLYQLKNNTPIVSLCFIDRKNLFVYKRKKLNYTKERFVETEMQKIKAENPLATYKEPRDDKFPKPAITFLKSSPFELTKQQVDEYNKQLLKYFEEHKLYAEKLFEVFNFKSHSIAIKLLLINSGTSPANDIDIELHFPDGFELLSAKDLPKVPEKNDLPYKPKSAFDSFPRNLIDLSALNTFRKTSFPVIDPNKPTIKKTNSYNVSYHLNTLKHNQNFELEPLYAKFNDINEAKGFSIQYELKISNIPKIIKGELHINFED